jgi:hypothetical protein
MYHSGMDNTEILEHIILKLPPNPPVQTDPLGCNRLIIINSY